MSTTHFEQDDFLSELNEAFNAAADADRARQMSAYLKNLFPFFGIPAGLRRELSVPYMKKICASPRAFEIIQLLFIQPEREFHYVAVETLFRCRKRFQPDTLHLLQWMITTNSWWDTVDALASQSVGHFLLSYPEYVPDIPVKWVRDPNMWLRRTALLFQLKYKQQTDTELLAWLIDQTRTENEFFIRKAIGWSLRELAKTDPDWVLSFVHSKELKPLSRKEALKHFQTS
ncbi:MAG: DNA alkylation repair protein [Flavobacteriales bacterium]|nr:DNA alkylation repair protein [Flavobacteriales bacterium]